MRQASLDIEQVRGSVYSWNSRFPLDRWWRRKHNIAIFSEAHLQSDFISQVLEYIEDMEYIALANKSDDEYVPASGDWLKVSTSRQASDIFDSVNLDAIVE